MADDFDNGMLVGLLIGEGHFGGDGRQPHITLRMHERHEALFRWLERTYPGGRLYGPYEHAGRRYYQWMARGTYLRDELVPLLQRSLSPERDGYAYSRFRTMCERYAGKLGTASPRPRLPTGLPETQSGRQEPAESEPSREERTHAEPVAELDQLRASRIFAALRGEKHPPASHA